MFVNFLFIIVVRFKFLFNVFVEWCDCWVFMVCECYKFCLKLRVLCCRVKSNVEIKNLY